MPRLLLGSALLALSIAAPAAALAQPLPLGSFIDAIGRAQEPAPAPGTVSPGYRPSGRVSPPGKNGGTRAKPVRRPQYENPGESGRTPPGYLLGNG
ncbi:MAG TPA: hypothetical protein VEZ16_16610 [Microvirga sp.]|nr:hypothetical protein [Microvirga sp.]